jgi:hypothetical protein
MMIISARFASTCPHCRGPVAPGDTVAWTKGKPARHTACNAFVAAEVPPAIALPDFGFVGTVGQEYTGELEITNTRDLTGRYGASRLHVMRDSEGHVFTWFASTARWNVGERVHLTGRVKAHNTYKGVSQTMLTRCVSHT